MDTERKPEQPINRVYQITAVLLLIGCSCVYMWLELRHHHVFYEYNSFMRYGWPPLAILLIGTLIYRLPLRSVLAGEAVFGVGSVVLYGIIWLGTHWLWGGILILISPVLLMVGADCMFRRFLPPNRRLVEFSAAVCMLIFISMLIPV
ncbi:MAG: hypothetical protein ACYDCO_05995 [Armatimonadota bacterium]